MKTTLILNKQRIQTLSDLLENFNSAEFIAYLKSGRVLKWLNELQESALAEKISSVNLDNKDAVKEIMEILSVAEDKCPIQEAPEEMNAEGGKVNPCSSFQSLADDFHGIRLSSTCFIEMVKIPTGSFQMGYHGFYGDYSRCSPIDPRFKFKVTFSKPFYVSTVCITQRQWNAVHQISEDERINYSDSLLSDKEVPTDGAMVCIDWYDANEFCAILNKNKSQYGIPNNYLFSLPSEWQWEYFARARSNSDEQFHSAGCSPNIFGNLYPNDFGSLLDGEGNRGLKNRWKIADIGVNGEWCSTPSFEYDGKDIVDPQDPNFPTSSERICRMEPCAGRLYYWKRWFINPKDISDFRSFRIVLRSNSFSNDSEQQ